MADGGASPEAVAKAESFYRDASRDLVNVFDGALIDWMTAVVTERGVAIAPDDPLVADLHQTLMAELRDAYDLPGADAPDLGGARNPLDIVRRGVAPLNQRLTEAGVVPPERDEFQVQIFPTDRYELGPSAFADLGDAVHNAGLRWGAAKAHLHLLRHRSG